MKTHENRFFVGSHPTFAMSRAIIGKLRANKAKPTTIALYVYIMEIAEGPKVRVKTSTLHSEVGLSDKTLKQAREELVKYKVVTAKETGAKGWWQFTLLNPTGGALATSNSYVDFSQESGESITSYYEQRLGQKLTLEHHDGVGFSCLFCHFKKASFKVHLAVGSELHGRYYCGNDKCGEHGGMIELEMALAKRAGKELNRTEAGRVVRNHFIGLKQEVKTAVEEATSKVKKLEAAKTLPWYVIDQSTVPVWSQLDDLLEGDEMF